VTILEFSLLWCEVGLGFHFLLAFTSILDAKASSSPSFTWRSLLCGRDLLKKGLGQVVGDGASIKFWGDKWLIGNRSELVDVSRNGTAGMLMNDFIQPDDHR